MKKSHMVGILFSAMVCTGISATKVHAIAPSTPVFKTVTAQNSMQTYLEWNPIADAQTYELARDGVVIYTGFVTNFYDFNVKTFDTYTYSLVAINEAGERSEPKTVTKKIAGSEAMLYYLNPSVGEFDRMFHHPVEGDNEFTLFVPNQTKEFTMGAISPDQFSTIKMNGKSASYTEPTLITLPKTTSEIDVDVTAADGVAKRHYDIHVKPYLEWNKTGLQEATANNGSITDSLTLKLNKKTFTDSLSNIQVNNVPEGLTPVIAKVSDNELKISFTGKAISHESKNNRSNLTVTIPSESILYAYNDYTYTSDPFSISFANPVIPISNPIGVTTSAGETYVKVSWQKNSAAIGYEVYRNGVKVYDGPSTTFVDSRVVRNTTYTYTVYAKNSTAKSTGVVVKAKTLDYKYKPSWDKAKQFYRAKDWYHAFLASQQSISFGNPSSEIREIFRQSTVGLKNKAYALSKSKSSYERKLAKTYYNALIHSPYTSYATKKDANYKYGKIK